VNVSTTRREANILDVFRTFLLEILRVFIDYKEFNEEDIPRWGYQNNSLAGSSPGGVQIKPRFHGSGIAEIICKSGGGTLVGGAGFGRLSPRWIPELHSGASMDAKNWQRFHRTKTTRISFCATNPEKPCFQTVFVNRVLKGTHLTTHGCR
jgi:hypothetical protein